MYICTNAYKSGAILNYKNCFDKALYDNVTKNKISRAKNLSSKERQKRSGLQTWEKKLTKKIQKEWCSDKHVTSRIEKKLGNMEKRKTTRELH